MHLPFVAARAFAGRLAEEAPLGEGPVLAAGRKLQFFAGQCGQCLCQHSVFAGVGQQAVVAGLPEVWRQYMEAKPAEELRSGQGHLLFVCAIGIILVCKAYRVLADIQDGLLNWILQKLF